MCIRISYIVLLLCMSSAAVSASPRVIRYVGMHQIGTQVVIVDTRAAARCQQRSLAGAHCLPATDLLGPSGELPNFADIFWALGTAGLDGSETVLVAGDNAQARNFIAGVLYLCGQAKIEILKPAITHVLQTGAYSSGQGIPRAILRQRIYHATMRGTAMLLPGELDKLHKKHLDLSYIDAAQLTHGMSASDNHKGLQVIYASSVRNAIAGFARVLARQGDSSRRIRVVPVAMNGRPGRVNNNAVHHSAETAARYRGVIIRGEKQWS